MDLILGVIVLFAITVVLAVAVFLALYIFVSKVLEPAMDWIDRW